MAAVWMEREGSGSVYRPAGWRLSGAPGFATVAVSPVLVEADLDWRSKPGSLEWQCSADAFNRNVGWKVACWHWSVVRMGVVVGKGDCATLAEAQTAAEAAL